MVLFRDADDSDTLFQSHNSSLCIKLQLLPYICPQEHACCSWIQLDSITCDNCYTYFKTEFNAQIWSYHPTFTIAQCEDSIWIHT